MLRIRPSRPGSGAKSGGGCLEQDVVKTRDVKTKYVKTRGVETRDVEDPRFSLTPLLDVFPRRIMGFPP
jgi:hypothetical protein